MSLQMFLDKRIDSVRMGKRRHMPRALDLTKAMIRQNSVKTVNNGGCGQGGVCSPHQQGGPIERGVFGEGREIAFHAETHSCATLSMLSRTLLWRSDGMLR